MEQAEEKMIDELVDISGNAFWLSDLELVGQVLACNHHEEHNHAGGIAHFLLVVCGNSIVIDLDGFLVGISTRNLLLEKWTNYKRRLHEHTTKNKGSFSQEIHPDNFA